MARYGGQDRLIHYHLASDASMCVFFLCLCLPIGSKPTYRGRYGTSESDIRKRKSPQRWRAEGLWNVWH